MVEGGVHQSHRDLWPWQKEVIGLLDSSLLKILNTQVLATVEAAVASPQPGSRPRLERTLKDAEHDFRFLSSSVVHSANIYLQEFAEESTSQPTRLGDAEKGNDRWNQASGK